MTKDGSLHTVSKDGFVFGKSEKIQGAKLGGNYLVSDEVKVLGSNFMINGNGIVFVMNKAGTLVENSVQHDGLNVKHYSSFK